MSLSARQLEKILTEIAEPLKGGRFQRIDQPQPWGLLFQIDQKGRRYRLYFSAHQRYSRFHLVTGEGANPPKPPQFCQLLRAHLRYKRISALHQIAGDRIVQMRCEWTEKDASADVSLIAELMGAASNFFLIDSKGTILGSLYPPRAGRSLRRRSTYQPPLINQRINRVMNQSAFFKETSIPLIEGDDFRFNRSVEAYYGTIEREDEEGARKRELLSQHDKAIRRLKKRLKQLSSDLSEAETSGKYRIQGNLLKNHMLEIRPGMKTFQCLDPTQGGNAGIVLELNPALSPSENLAWYFKRYKKGQSARSPLKGQIEKAKDEIARLEQDRRIVSEGGALGPAASPIFPSPQKKERRPRKSGPPTYLSSDGVALIVGRNDRENEAVTFRIARGDDLWFHARGVPGSHLIVRMERRRVIPYQTLLDAATLALYFSRGRRAGKGDVLYTFRKYIQKSKRERPGSVISSQDKNIYIEIEKARLERILQSRMGLP